MGYRLSSLFKLTALTVLSTLTAGLTYAQSSWVEQTTGTNKTLRGIAFDGTSFVCVADDGIIITSTDGVTWNTSSSGTTTNLRSVTFSPTLWVAAGESGTIVTSPDGTTWTTQTTPASVANKQLSGVAYGNGIYVAVGASGNVIYSSDAVTWNNSNPVPLPFFLQSVTFGAGKFVAVGASGTIMHSVNGIDWFAASAGSSAFYNGITHGDGVFLAVSQGNSVIRSVDAINWESHLTGSISPLRCIHFADGRFIAGGDDGVILASDHGINWAAQESGAVESLFSLTYGAGMFVAAGGRLDETAAGVPSLITTSPNGLDFGFEWESELVTINEIDGSATFNITRVGSTDTAASVDWILSGGSASSPEDFIDTSGSVSFAIGEISRPISIPIIDDTLIEGQESIELTLQSSSPAFVIHGNPLATINILDDEDMDNDGLGDSWEVLHFEVITAYGAGDDPDNDNNDNLREQADGTDPDDISSAKYILTTNVASGSGSVSASPDKISYDAGEVVTLTAIPALGYEFDSWTNFSIPQTTPVDLPPLSSDTTIGANFSVSLSAALDQPGLDWFTGTDWIGQTSVSFDSEDAAFADGDNIDQGDSLIIETVVDGNSTLTFRWMISAGADRDYLRFYIDGEEVDAITGITDWEQKSYTLEPGIHLLTWSYDRSSSGSPTGLNAAWLDTVEISQSYTQWQSEFFTPAEILDPLISDPDEDPDGDGRSNFLEYALGANPRSGSAETSTPLISIMPLETGGETDHAAITFSRPITRLADVTYEVESSTTLLPGSWEKLIVTPTILSTTSGIQTVRIIDPSPMLPKNHYRLSLSPQQE